MGKENWYTEFATIKEKHRKEFDALVAKIQPIVKKLEGRMSYRDLYDISKDASITAVANLVCHRVDKKSSKKKKKK